MAGFSIDHLGHAAACLVGASQPLIAVALLLAWGRLFPAGNPRALRGTGAPGALGERGILLMLVTSGMVQLGQDLFHFFLPIYGHSIGLSASAIGTILATLAVASFVVRLYLARLVKQVAAEKLLVWVFFAGAIGYVLVPFFTHPVALGAIAFLFGLGMGIGVPLTVILMFERSAEGRSGRTLGLRLTANNVVRMAGPMVFGVVGTALGLPPVFWINAALMAAGGLLAVIGSRAPPR
jgi:predicted MFS family arabinose efflux permease